jgi:hypothetical protein
VHGREAVGYEVYMMVGEHYRERLNRRQQKGPNARNEKQGGTITQMKIAMGGEEHLRR